MAGYEECFKKSLNLCQERRAKRRVTKEKKKHHRFVLYPCYIISTTSSELFMIFSYTCPSVLEFNVSVLSPSVGWY